MYAIKVDLTFFSRQKVWIRSRHCIVMNARQTALVKGRSKKQKTASHFCLESLQSSSFYV